MTKKQSIHYAYFNHKEIPLPLECVQDCSQQGDMYDNVSYWQSKIKLNLSRDDLINGLKETGGWTKDELTSMSDDDLEMRAIWVMACDVKDEIRNHE